MPIKTEHTDNMPIKTWNIQLIHGADMSHMLIYTRSIQVMAGSQILIIKAIHFLNDYCMALGHGKGEGVGGGCAPFRIECEAKLPL